MDAGEAASYIFNLLLIINRNMVGVFVFRFVVVFVVVGRTNFEQLIIVAQLYSVQVLLSLSLSYFISRLAQSPTN